MGLCIMQGAQGADVAQHESEVGSVLDAEDMVYPGLALAPYIAAAHGAAIAVPYQGKTAQGFPCWEIVEAACTAGLGHSANSCWYFEGRPAGI